MKPLKFIDYTPVRRLMLVGVSIITLFLYTGEAWSQWWADFKDTWGKL